MVDGPDAAVVVGAAAVVVPDLVPVLRVHHVLVGDAAEAQTVHRRLVVVARRNGPKGHVAQGTDRMPDGHVPVGPTAVVVPHLEVKRMVFSHWFGLGSDL